MALMDEFKEEREKIKNGTPEQKWKYFKDYYLKWVIAGVITFIVVVILLIDVLTKKENMLSVMFVNFSDQGGVTANIEMPFTNEYLPNPKKQEITLETGLYIPTDPNTKNTNYTYQDQQRFSMLLMAGEIDLMITDEKLITSLAEQEYVLPLTRLFSDDELKKYADTDRIVYLNDTPIAIRMDDCALINENMKYKGDNAADVRVCAAFSGIKRTDMAKQFLNFID